MAASFHIEYFIALLCAVVSLLFFFVHREKSLSPKILALYFLCISYLLFTHALVRYGDFVHFPHLWRTPVFFGALNPILAFIYVRSVLEKRFCLRLTDVLLFAVPVLMALNFWEFFRQPAAAKVATISMALANKSYYLEENEGWLPPGFALSFRIFFGLSLVFGQAILIWRWYTANSALLPYYQQHRSIFKWLVFFTSAMGITFVLNAVQYLFQFFQSGDFYWIICSTVMLAALSALTYLFIRPNILYGLHGWAVELPETNETTVGVAEGKSSAAKPVLSGDEHDKLHEKLTVFIHEQKPYLRKGYTIANMSAELSVPLYQLSSFINQQYGKSFNEFINGYRVQYIKDVLLKEPNAEQYTLEAMAQKAGFNSRSTFIAAVKKQTGQTPTSFLLNR